MSLAPSPVASPLTLPSPKSSPSPHPPLTPLITSPLPGRRPGLSRPPSHLSRHRLSQYSAGSAPRSRPVSILDTTLPSFSYSLVRDFAYNSGHPLHYGIISELSKPPSAGDSQRRMSDPEVQWETKMPWEAWDHQTTADPPLSIIAHFSDGPPWSEDEDLHSPIVSLRHRKNKMSSASLSSTKQSTWLQDESDSDLSNPISYDRARSDFYGGIRPDGSRHYDLNDDSEPSELSGQYITFPPNTGPREDATATNYQLRSRQPRKFAHHQNYPSDSETPNSGSQHGCLHDDASRYSRDYQFTITSPDEEMHGKAVALFDFESENENELPLVEGQIIWVSYRHGQGWLVAKDPKTQENGLVPEAYVRLLREIEGGIHSLTGTPGSVHSSPHEAGTPTQADQNLSSLNMGGQTPTPSSTANGFHQPVVSTFSTSSKDLDLYPTNRLGIHVGQSPPEVVHYHGQRGGSSQSSTPVISFDHYAGFQPHSSPHFSRRDSDPNTSPIMDPTEAKPGPTDAAATVGTTSAAKLTEETNATRIEIDS